MSRVHLGRKTPFEDVVRRAAPSVQPAEHSHRMAIAMFWGIVLSLLLWAGFLALIL